MIKKNFDDDTKMFNSISENTKKCKCGHSVVINKGVEKVLCSWCNHYVFRNKKDEDLYRINERLKNNK